MSYYAWIMLLSLLGPLALSFDKKVAFYKSWGPLFAGIAINAALFILWDGWFARTAVWGFNPLYVWSLSLNDLPLEEWSFFIVVPYCSVFIYACLKAYIKKEPFAGTKHSITLIALLITLALVITQFGKTYTFVNSLIACLLLAYHYFFLKKAWMGYFWLAYIIHLIPFFIVNGLLTGAATPEPVVWYNNEENLGIRLYTIPVEDTIYALTCLLLPITIMEWLQSRK